MEASDLCENLASRRTPHIDINKLALCERLLLSTTHIVLRAIEPLSSHLACRYDVLIRVHRHGDNVLVMQVEELLLILINILNDTNTCCCKDNATIGCVP